MLSFATALEFTNGFTGISSFPSDAILWCVFVAIVGIFACAVYLVNGK